MTLVIITDLYLHLCYFFCTNFVNAKKIVNKKNLLRVWFAPPHPLHIMVTLMHHTDISSEIFIFFPVKVGLNVLKVEVIFVSFDLYFLLEKNLNQTFLPYK